MIQTKHIIIVVIVFVSGIGTGILIKPDHHSYNEYKKVLFSNDEYAKNTKYKLVNPLLSCNDISNITNKQTDTIESNIRAIIKKQEDAGNITDASIYFRDLNNGPWVGINQDATFIPGSLLKVPLLISVLKIIEDNPKVLDQTITYEGNDGVSIPQEFKPAVELEKGKSYTVAQLLQIMTIYSSNNSAVILSKMFDHVQLTSIYSDIGLSIPQDGSDYTMTVRDYASFFRILYNATYLTQQASETALELLSQSDFDKGLVSGIPKSITVSHKFGERNDNGLKQLHDCGIVYYPKQPYMLCVMTKGSDMNKMAQVIGSISKSVYESIDNK